MAPFTREQKVMAILEENRHRYLSANDVYCLVIMRWFKKNRLKSERTIWQLLRRIPNLDRQTGKDGKTYYRLND